MIKFTFKIEKSFCELLNKCPDSSTIPQIPFISNLDLKQASFIANCCFIACYFVIYQNYFLTIKHINDIV